MLCAALVSVCVGVGVCHVWQPLHNSKLCGANRALSSAHDNFEVS